MEDIFVWRELTPRLRLSLERAVEVARERGHPFVGQEHVLLGVLAVPDGIGAKALAELGVADALRVRLEAIMDSPNYFAPPPPMGADLELRKELLRRRDADQEPRRKMRPGAPLDPAVVEQMEATDRDNVQWLKAVVAARGWPGRSQVGEDGADAAWLIVQHADRYPEFQVQCLRLIEAAVAAGEALPRHAAYLTDRVMLKERGVQRYGTQFKSGNNGLEPFPLEDSERVDELRATAGLEPLEEYRKRFLDPG